MKKILTIHEINETISKIPLEEYVLTFDDGLYTQYKHFNIFRKIKTKKIFFISTNIVCIGKQSEDYITCSAAHKKAFLGNTENYMTVNQIREIMQDPWVTIGGHSHYHTDLNSLESNTERIKHIIDDTTKMLSWFSENLSIVPISFCFPYNNDLDGLYQGVLSKFGFTEFYGRERIPIERLLQN